MINSNVAYNKKDSGMSSDIKTIWEAAASDDVDALNEALNFYSVNETDENGMTPLHAAAGHLAEKTVDRLLEFFGNGLDVSIEDNFGRTVSCMPINVWGTVAGKNLTNKLRPYVCPDLFGKNVSESTVLSFPSINIE